MNQSAKTSLLSRFMLRPCHWDAQAEAWARKLPHDSPEDYGDHFSRLIKTGKARAFEVIEHDNPKRVAILIASEDRVYPSGELAIRGAYCAVNRGDLTAEFLPQIEALARVLNCATVRFHTMRPGLIKKAMQRGFRVCEVIVRKDVRHV